MLKKVLVVAALLCVMVPFAAQDKAGKWGVEVSGWMVRPLGLDTTYAYAQNEVLVVPPPVTGVYAPSMGAPYSIGNEYRWSPNLKVSYATDAFTFWVDYTSYDQTSFSAANGATSNIKYAPLAPVLADHHWFAGCDLASATLRTTYTNWDINAGHVFHPTDKWALMVYGGLRYLRLENDVHATYVDIQGWSGDGLGTTDAVRLHANMTGWGLNFGFTNDFTFGKRWALGTGLEVSTVRTTNDLDQNEVLNSTKYATWDLVNTSSSKQKVTPALKMYAEAKLNFNDSWYAKLGYRFDYIHDAFGYDYNTGTPDFSATRHNGGYFPTNKDVTFDGLYFTLGFKF
jgi:hypothetical protein